MPFQPENLLAQPVTRTLSVELEPAQNVFHSLVLLAHAGLTPDDVLAELQRRFGRSGLEEKAARGKSSSE